MIASTLSIALLAALNDRPTHDEIMGWIDVETILLLFSMMILVGILTETGVFDHLAVYAYRVFFLTLKLFETIFLNFFKGYKRTSLASHPFSMHYNCININVVG